jgi:AraC-like DNA-binding protein
MPARTVAMISSVSTEAVEPEERVGYWEEYNRRNLVGLACSSYSEHGLLARQANVVSGGLRIADIAGNEHVIERTPRICRTLPKDSVFASLLLDGDAVFFHSGGVLPVPAGRLVLYETDRPYLFGFPSPMRKLLVDIPRSLFTERCLAGGIAEPMVLGNRSATDAGVLSALRSVVDALADGRAMPAGEDPETTVLDLIRSLAGESLAGHSAQLAVAKKYIDRHLLDPGLCAEDVAAAVGMSARHLRRVFEPEEISPSRYIMRRRLEMAHRQLREDPAIGTIADVAHRWGFASQPHFTRVFRDHFGQTPGEVRMRTGSGEPDRDHAPDLHDHR